LVPPLGGPERIVASVPSIIGPARAIAWSPDSKSLVIFDQPTSQAPGLWLISVETGERRRLTTLPNDAYADIVPAFSPDARSLAFARATEATPEDVYVLPLGQGGTPAGQPRRITDMKDAVWGVAWTANGQELIWSSGAPGNSSL